MVADGLTYNNRNDKFAFTDGRSVKNDTSIDIQKPKVYTNGHFKSDLTINIGNIPIFKEKVQIWADHPKTFTKHNEKLCLLVNIQVNLIIQDVMIKVLKWLVMIVDQE